MLTTLSMYINNIDWLVLLNQAQFVFYLALVVINHNNRNLQFIFIILLSFKLFDVKLLAPAMEVIAPFYLEHLVESSFNWLAALAILKRAKIAGWVSYDSRYLGYMQEFGLYSLYILFSLLSFLLFVEGAVYYYTDLFDLPLTLFTYRIYFYYALLLAEIFILVSLTRQNLNGTLPVKCHIKI